MNVFEGGFLGLDNIGPIDRSAQLPVDGRLGAGRRHGVDGHVLPQPARDRPGPRRARPRVRGHGHQVPRALRLHRHRQRGACGTRRAASTTTCSHLADGGRVPLRVRSMVGLLPLAATTTLGPATLDAAARLRRAACGGSPTNKPELRRPASPAPTCATASRAGCSSVVPPERLRRILAAMLDEAEFLSPHGLRALSARHRDDPFSVDLAGMQYSVDYEPAESTTGLFGGNSNWRGPVWFPVNHLLVEAVRALRPLLRRRRHGRVPDRLRPAAARSSQVADELSRRLVGDVPRRRRRAPAGVRTGREAPARPGAARPAAVQRVLPRRHRRRPRRLAPDRLDRPRRRPPHTKEPTVSTTPIADHALISDCRSAAIVDRAGSVEWLCWPRTDAPSIFGRLLDPSAGHWSIAPVAEADVERRYVDRTMVVETTFTTASGTVTVRAPCPAAVRPRHPGDRAFDDGRAPARWARRRGPVDAGPRHRGRRSRDGPLHAGGLASRCRSASTIAVPTSRPPGASVKPISSDASTAPSRRGDRGRRLHQRYEGPWRHLVHHSGRVLQAFTFAPTGAIAAAATTSLPESVGGPRNWDYRYSCGA